MVLAPWLQSLLSLLNWILLYTMVFFSLLSARYMLAQLCLCVCVTYEKQRPLMGTVVDCLNITRYSHQTGYIWVFVTVYLRQEQGNKSAKLWMNSLFAEVQLANLLARHTALTHTITDQYCNCSSCLELIEPRAKTGDAIGSSVLPLAFCNRHI